MSGPAEWPKELFRLRHVDGSVGKWQEKEPKPLFTQELVERVVVVPAGLAIDVLAELSAPVGRLNLQGPDVEQADINLIVACVRRLRSALSECRGVAGVEGTKE